MRGTLWATVAVLWGLLCPALRVHAQEQGAPRGNVLTPELVLDIGRRTEVERLTLSADGRTLAVQSGGADSEISLWDMETGERTGAVRPYFETVSAIALTGDSRFVAAAGYAIKIWRVADGQLVTRWQKPNLKKITDLAFLEHPLRLALATETCETFITPVDSIDLARPLRGGLMLSICRDGSRLANVLPETLAETGYVPRRSAKVMFFDIATGKETGELEEELCRAIEISGSARLLAVSTTERTVRVYDLAAKRRVAELRADEQTFDDVFFLGDRRVLARGSGGRLVLWELPASDPVRVWRLDLGKGRGNCATSRGTSAFDRRTRRIVLGGLKGHVFVVAVPTVEEGDSAEGD